MMPVSRVVQRDVRDVGLEHRADLLADEVEQRREVELARELLRHRVDGRELGRALLRFGEQARILDGDRRLQRESDQEIELAWRRTACPPVRHTAITPLTVLPAMQRRHHQPLVLGLLGARDLHRARIRRRCR